VRDVKREIDDRYNQALTIWQSFWTQADLDVKVSVGDTTQSLSRYSLNEPDVQRQLKFNKVLRVLNMISGYQRKNRLTSVVVPVEVDDEDTASQLSGVLQWVMQTDNMYNTISDAFESTIQCGLNLLSLWVDHSRDIESGDIRCSRLGYNSFIMDPFFSKPDLSDCSWILTRRYVSANNIGVLYPNLDEGDLADLKRNQFPNDNKFNYLPEYRYQKQDGTLTYDEYWTSDTRKIYYILDMTTGETMLWNRSKSEFRELRETYPFLKLIPRYRPTVRRTVLINGNVVHTEQRPWGLDKYPFVPVFCHFTPDLPEYQNRFMSVTRIVRDSQIELNIRRNKILSILDAQVNSGLMVKENALVDPKHAFTTGVGRVLFFRDESDLQQDVRQIAPPPTPQGDGEMQALLEKEIMENAGTTEELFGQSDTQSGIQEMLRQGAALVGLQGLFDRLNQSQKILGNLCLDLIQENFSSNKVSRVLNRQPTESFFSDERSRLFDCVVEQGLLTSTQKQMEFAQLLQLKQLGIQIPDDILLQKSTLQNKSDLVKAIQKQQQQTMQQLQEQRQLEMQKLEIETEVLRANAENNRAMARERETRAVSNIGLAQERISQAEQDRAQASLDNAKAIKEIESIGIDNSMRIAEFLKEVQQEQRSEQQKELQKTEMEASMVGAKAEESEYER
jgi:hypothetical protein